MYHSMKALDEDPYRSDYSFTTTSNGNFRKVTEMLACIILDFHTEMGENTGFGPWGYAR